MNSKQYKELYFKCTLKSNIVLNASLATEGNMKSLDYIPGSNFMGIVASYIYRHDPILAMDYVHNGRVSYGDAFISDGQTPSYTLPLSLFRNKLSTGLTTNDPKYLYHLIDEGCVPKHIQIQQQRTGFFNQEGRLWTEVEKTMSLKSAYDSLKRKSADSQMYGFEAIVKGQVFVFSVIMESELDEKIIKQALLGDRKVGKSKSAEYGWVYIEELQNVKPISTTSQICDYALVYAQSNLCFYDEFGFPTYKPTVQDLGLDGGQIDWQKSQVRTIYYSPWNSCRNATSTQRNCICKGSVFYVKNPQISGDNYRQVGEYINEGLGRIVINPSFLFDTNGAEWKFPLHIKKEAQLMVELETPKTPLQKFLKRQKEYDAKQFEIANTVIDLVNEYTDSFKIVTKNQWGNIRQLASEVVDMDVLYDALFESKKGLLTHGVSADNYWLKYRSRNLELFKKIFTENKELGNVFVAKFAAEMAKSAKK